MGFRDRRTAGAAVAGDLTGYAGRSDVVVLGLVRGGMPVAYEVARRLGAPLDALVIRKLGVPWSPEVAFGALGPDGRWVLNEEISSRLSTEEVAAVVRHESAELLRRERRYRQDHPAVALHGRTVLIVDDGLATGATARAAVAVVRGLGAAHVVLVIPVGAADAVARLRRVADEVICPVAPTDFGAVSRFYDDFDQVTDAEVIALLTRARSMDG